jgi:hypothetical protein
MSTKSEFDEHRKGNNESSVWHHFLIERNGQLAKCKQCSKEIRCGGGSTSGLHTHLKTMHGINKRKISEITSSISSDQDQPSQSKKSNLITSFFKTDKNERLAKVLARMTARDGLSFNIFNTSIDIREGLIARGFKELPKSANTIRNMVLDYGKNIRTTIRDEIAQLKSKGKRFSVTFDEWTSIRNRRYLNINVHTTAGLFWNIGLARAFGSMPAERCLVLVKEKLKEFNLCISKDIVCVTTDGASVMVKLGKLIDAEQQICLAHGINLAITDILYKSTPNEALVVCEMHDEEENDDVDEEENVGGVIIESNLVSNVNISHITIGPLVKKIRKVVKMFRKSPTKNDIFLQKYIKEQFGKEVALHLDCKTRWNSMLFMLEIFYKLRYCVQKALIDVNSGINFCDEEFTLLSATITALTPIKLAVDALCRQDANLLTADATIKFMMEALSNQNCAIAKELYDALKFRISQRRTDLSQLLYYLQSGEQDLDQILFPKLTKPVMTRIIIRLIKRLSSENANQEKQPTSEEEVTAGPSSTNSKNTDIPTPNSIFEHDNLKLKLQFAIQQKLSIQPRITRVQGLEQIIKDEVAIFEKTGARGKHLQLVYDYLCTITPTSVESERAFSAASQICTKIRSSLRDETIDCLCFLRAYFNKLDGNRETN